MSDIVKIDGNLLREEILKKYTFNAMAKIIDRQPNMFATSAPICRTGSIDVAILEKICTVLNKEPGFFLIPEPEPEPEPIKPVETHALTEPVASSIDCNKVIQKEMTKIYEGVEMNGQAIGKVLEAIKENTDAVKEQTEAVNKLLTVMNNWSRKWANHKKYGRF